MRELTHHLTPHRPDPHLVAVLVHCLLLAAALALCAYLAAAAAASFHADFAPAGEQLHSLRVAFHL